MLEDFRLKVFMAVAEEGSFTRAAKSLGVTQPAVSQNIAELEKQTGAVVLPFSRCRNPTAAGVAFRNMPLESCIGTRLLLPISDQRTLVWKPSCPDSGRCFADSLRAAANARRLARRESCYPLPRRDGHRGNGSGSKTLVLPERSAHVPGGSLYLPRHPSGRGHRAEGVRIGNGVRSAGTSTGNPACRLDSFRPVAAC